MQQKPTTRTEVLLFQAARAQLIDEVIAPALQQGTTVISDRSFWSSVAYQGYGRGCGVQTIRDLSDFAIGEITPQRVYLLDIDPERALQRKSTQKEETRFEAELLEFHRRVRVGFLEQAEINRLYFRVLDATKDPNSLHEEIYHDFQQMRQKQN